MIPADICAIPECGRPIKSRDWCSRHLSRWYRHGNPLGAKKPQPGTVASSGYRELFKPGHPLARPSGRIYEHRLVLYAVIGDGPHPCNWCLLPVTWESMDVDHIDRDKANNTPMNLVPSCHRCNIRRTRDGSPHALVPRRSAT